eukprot:7433462-Heterocapsa_arctica.AAC.1
MDLAAKGSLGLKTGVEDSSCGPSSSFLQPLEPADPRKDRSASLVPGGLASMVGPGPPCRTIYA